MSAHRLCLVLVGACVTAVSARGFPFLSHVLQIETTDNADITQANETKSSAPKESPPRAKHVEDWEPKSKRHSVSTTSLPTQSKTPPERRKTPAKYMDADMIPELIKQKDALMRSSSTAMDHYAKAVLNAQSIQKDQEKVEKKEEQAQKAVEAEVERLHDAKEIRMEATKADMKSNPLEPAYDTTRKELDKAAARVATEEKRVGEANSRAHSINEEAEKAKEMLEHAAERTNTYDAEVKAALKDAENLAALMQQAKEKHAAEMHQLEEYAKDLKNEEGLISKAISDAKKPIVAPAVPSSGPVTERRTYSSSKSLNSSTKSKSTA